VNLIGEHTDYSGGFVMPIALPYEIRVELTPRTDRLVHSSSRELSGVHEHEIGREKRRGTWSDHVQGTTHVLARAGLLDHGFDARISSDIPIGAGLGSSGALGVALLRAAREAFGLSIEDVAIAQLAQRAEREIVGSQAGIMDQMAASLALENEALFLDCRSLAFQRIPLPPEVDLVVVHSGVTHQHSAGEYNERRRQCEEAAKALGVPELRDTSTADLERIEELPEPLRRRARHVVTENARVLEAVETLRARDLDRLGALLDASHRSLRDDFEVSTPEVDLLVELAREQSGVFGARITGGGFGGSIVALAEQGSGRAAAAAAAAEYEQRTGRDARILLPVPDAMTAA
jgi:galactokinase